MDEELPPNKKPILIKGVYRYDRKPIKKEDANAPIKPIRQPMPKHLSNQDLDEAMQEVQPPEKKERGLIGNVYDRLFTQKDQEELSQSYARAKEGVRDLHTAYGEYRAKEKEKKQMEMSQRYQKAQEENQRLRFEQKVKSIEGQNRAMRPKTPMNMLANRAYEYVANAPRNLRANYLDNYNRTPLQTTDSPIKRLLMPGQSSNLQNLLTSQGSGTKINQMLLGSKQKAPQSKLEQLIFGAPQMQKPQTKKHKRYVYVRKRV